MKAIILKIFILLQIISFKNSIGQLAWFEVETDLDEKLSKVFFINQDTGIAIGYYGGTNGQIYRTANGGRNWQITQTTDNNIFSSIFFLNENIGWVAGYNRMGFGQDIVISAVAYKTTNGGNTWEQKILSDSLANRLKKVAFVNDSCGWILCEYGDNVGIQGNDYLLRTTDGGDTWEKLSFNVSNNRITDFQFINNNVGFCGYNGLFKSTDGGNTWIRKLSSGNYTDYHCLQFVNDSVGWTAGQAIHKTTDGGETWVLQKRIADNGSYHPNVMSCYFINENSGWAGTELFTSDGGESWNEYNPGIDYLSDFCFISDSLGYAIAGANGGYLYKTTLGGVSNYQTQLNSQKSDLQILNTYPNPFKSTTTIRYSLIKPENITIVIFSMAGEEVEILTDNFQTAGEHEITWQPKRLPAGVYFVKLQAGGLVETKKLVLKN